MLQEHHLKFDRMFHRMAIVFHDGSGFFREFIDKLQLRPGCPVWRNEFLAREAESVGLPVMRGSQHDEDAVAVQLAECAIGGAIRLPAAERAYMRRGDADEVVACLLSATRKILG